jgi:RNA polymerase sigma factor (sigma-70 family)
MPNPVEFPTTRWTVVLSAGSQDDPQSRRALAELCQAYWRPLYAFVRKRGYGPEEAQDLTQDFFATLLEKEYVARADSTKGRFRSFLLFLMKCFLADDYDRRQAAKRGGKYVLLSISFKAGEEACRWEPYDCETPEKIFEREWALTLVSRVTTSLRDSFERDGRIAQFERLKQFLPGHDACPSYAEAAQQLGISEGATKVAVHRLRHRYRQFLHREIAQTLDDPGDIESEIRYLMKALAS